MLPEQSKDTQQFTEAIGPTKDTKIREICEIRVNPRFRRDTPTV